MTSRRSCVNYFLFRALRWHFPRSRPLVRSHHAADTQLCPPRINQLDRQHVVPLRIHRKPVPPPPECGCQLKRRRKKQQGVLAQGPLTITLAQARTDAHEESTLPQPYLLASCWRAQGPRDRRPSSVIRNIGSRRRGHVRHEQHRGLMAGWLSEACCVLT